MNFSCLGIAVDNKIFENLEKIIEISNVINHSNGKVYNKTEIEGISQHFGIDAMKCFVWVDATENIKWEATTLAIVLLNSKDGLTEVDEAINQFRFVFGHSRVGEVLQKFVSHKEAFSFFMNTFNIHMMKGLNHKEFRVYHFINKDAEVRYLALEPR